MNRTADEAEYVLQVLRQMRKEVFQAPQLFDEDALERIEEAMARIELQQESKAA